MSWARRDLARMDRARRLERLDTVLCYAFTAVMALAFFGSVFAMRLQSQW